MATEILVNDGGAPCRIIPITASSSAIEAGLYVDVDSSGELILMTDDQKAGTAKAMARGVGVLLTDVAANGIGNVITGRGIVCNVQSEAGVNAGDNVTIGALGQVELTVSYDTDLPVGVALADTFAGTDSGGNATNFCKVLLF